MRWKRAILLASAALLAGAVVNVGVAWWFACTVHPSFFYRSWTSLNCSWPMRVPSTWPVPNGGSIASWPSAGCQMLLVSAWGKVGANEEWKSITMAFGWPRVCLVIGGRGHTLPDGSIIEEAPSGWDGIAVNLRALNMPMVWAMGTGSKGSMLQGPALPLIPLWPGFLINTLFYAAIISAPFALFAGVRRWRRRAHYQCPSCAYDLRGLAPAAPCPECGAASGQPAPPSVPL